MLTWLFILFVVVGACVAFLNWRLGVFLMITVGVLQDPIRKLTPGAPAIMVLSMLPVWIAAFVGLISRRGNPIRYFRRVHPRVCAYIMLFAVSLIPGSLLVFQYGAQAWKVAVLGVFGYMNPMAAVVIGFLYVRQARQLDRLLAFYCVLTSVMMVGTVLEYLDILPGWPALGTEVFGTDWIRYQPGYIMQLIAGFYRSPDVMGWHAAALVIFGVTLAFRLGLARGWPWLAAAAWGAVCVLLGGRRKSIMMPPIWACVVVWDYFRSGKIGRVVGFAFMVVIGVAGVYVAGNEVGIHEDYISYAHTDTAEVSQRVQAHSWRAVRDTYRQSGFWGKGIGMASQGVQHLGVGIQRSWQEGGLPKLMVELGVLGLVCGALLAIALARAGRRVVLSVPQDASSYPLLIGVVAFIVANACSFIASHQIYNDPLIMTLTMFFVGVMLSGARWCGSGVGDYPPRQLRQGPVVRGTARANASFNWQEPHHGDGRQRPLDHRQSHRTTVQRSSV